MFSHKYLNTFNDEQVRQAALSSDWSRFLKKKEESFLSIYEIIHVINV